MNPSIQQQLKRRRPEIRARWEALLRLERPVTPLGTPDILVHLFDHTLDDVLASKHPARQGAATTGRRAGRCDCNPLRPYFATLEQALLEALIWAQASDPALGTEERIAQVGELCERMRRVAHREIKLLDAVCQCTCVEFPPT